MTQLAFQSTGAEVVNAFKDRVRGRTILITGPSASGIGGATALALSRGEPGHLILTSRKYATIQPVVESIQKTYPHVQVSFVECDLASQNSIRSAASNIRDLVPSIDILINNAAVPPCTFSRTEDGIELQFGVDHIGHFLLTNLVIPKIVAAGPGARIVNVSSSAMRFSTPLSQFDFEDIESYTALAGYAQAKGANILFTKALAERLKPHNMQSFSLHPGGIDTGMKAAVSKEALAEASTIRKDAVATDGQERMRPKRKSLEQGCATTIVAALDPSLEHSSGVFLEDCCVSPRVLPIHLIESQEAERLWTFSEQLVGEKFDWI